MDSHRRTRKQKEANKFQWYKEHIDKYTRGSESHFSVLEEEGASNDRKLRMKVNYDLFNNKIDMALFEKVCYPFGKNSGVSSSKLTNKDIVSGKIKALIGMELNRPFSWRLYGVNQEVVARKQQVHFDMMKEAILEKILAPIKKQIEAELQQIPPEQQQQAQAELEQKQEAMTPPEVNRYMERTYRDSAEILGHQILEYLMEKEQIKNKFIEGWKHSLITGMEVYWTGIVNGEPVLRVINPLNFNCGHTSELIEDAEWASYERFMSFSEVVNEFSNDLTISDLDKLKEESEGLSGYSEYFQDNVVQGGLRVVHCEWKALKPLQFLTTIDPETDEEYELIVDEDYKLNKEAGDISIETKWFLTKYEGYKIGNETYVGMREVPGQNVSMEKHHKCKLSYKGIIYDSMNSQPTSLMDRMKSYQYLYNIIVYRIESLVNSDKGKVMFVNSTTIPLGSANLTLDKWFHYTYVNQFGLLNPSEEGARETDINGSVKVVDMSLISDIQKYIQLADYVERRCGESVGINKQVEGQIGQYETSSNTQTAVNQSVTILEPYFNAHAEVKRNILQSLVDTAKVAFTHYKPKYLSYVLDDLSQQMLSIDFELLDNSEYGIFVANASKGEEALNTIKQLSHAAMQNQAIDMSDVLKIIKSESITEAEELLRDSETRKKKEMEQMQQQQQQSEQQMQQEMIAWEKEKMQMAHQFKMEEIKAKGEIDLQRQAMFSSGFNEDKDMDNDGQPDIVELYKAGRDADIAQDKLLVEREKIEQKRIEAQNAYDLKMEELNLRERELLQDREERSRKEREQLKKEKEREEEKKRKEKERELKEKSKNNK